MVKDVSSTCQFIVDEQHNNVTSKRLMLYLGNDYIDWIDFYTLCVIDGKLNDFDRKAYYAKLLSDSVVIDDYEERLGQQVLEQVAGNNFPLIYAAGSIVNQAFNKFTKMTCKASYL